MRSLVPLFLLAAAASAPALAVEPVPVPNFRSIELHGGGTVTVVPAAVQRVTFLEGSPQFTRVRVDRDGKLTGAVTLERLLISLAVAGPSD